MRREAVEITSPWRHLVLVAIVAMLAYLPSLDYGFAHDDVPIIVENDRLDEPWNVALHFGTDYWNSSAGTNLYRPLTLWTLAVDRAVFGRGPFGVHLVNVVLNGIVCALAYLLARRLLARPYAALAVGVLYALHPLHVEVVANGVGRAELGAALFSFAAMLLHLRVVDPERAVTGRTRIAGVGGALLLYFVAMLFKESAVAVPGLIWLADTLALRDGRWRTAWRRAPGYFLYAIPLGLYLVLRFRVVPFQSLAIPEVMRDAASWQRIVLAIDVLGRYVLQFLAPVRFSADYSDYTDLGRDLTLARALPGLALLTALAIAAFIAKRRGAPVVALGLLLFFVALLPVSNLLFAIGTIRADRLMFLPSFGLALALGPCVAAAGRRAPWPTVGLVVALALGASWRTMARASVWRDEVSIVRATVRDNPGCAPALGKLGAIEQNEGDADAALEAYARAIELFEGAGSLDAAVAVNYAQMLVERNDIAGADRLYRAILDRAPDNYPALLNLGAMRFERGRRAEGILLLRRAVASDPRPFEGHYNLAQALLIEDRAGEARVAIEVGLTHHPDHPALNALRRQLPGAGG